MAIGGGCLLHMLQLGELNGMLPEGAAPFAVSPGHDIPAQHIHTGEEGGRSLMRFIEAGHKIGAVEKRHVFLEKIPAVTHPVISENGLNLPFQLGIGNELIVQRFRILPQIRIQQGAGKGFIIHLGLLNQTARGLEKGFEGGDFFGRPGLHGFAFGHPFFLIGCCEAGQDRIGTVAAQVLPLQQHLKIIPGLSHKNQIRGIFIIMTRHTTVLPETGHQGIDLGLELLEDPVVHGS